MIKIADSLSKSSTLLWLESVLYERFGVPLCLEISDCGFPILSAVGLAGVVEFNTNGSEFDNGPKDVPFAFVDLSPEPVKSFLPGLIPAPGYTENSNLLRRGKHGLTINYNIVALVYWSLNRIEELNGADLDNHGRFPAKSSHAFRYNYLSRPVVDEWLFILGQIIIAQWPELVLKKHNFEMTVSHDVDMPGRYAFASMFTLFRRMCGDILRGNIKGFLLAPFSRFGTKSRISRIDPANTFEWLMDVSERQGVRSAFYFICGRTNPLLDGDYEIEHPAMRSLLRRINSRGHEIGIHPSYNTYQNASLIDGEVSRLREVCDSEGIVQNKWGGRMHYLRWEHPTTLLAWDAASLNYDSTLGYADVPGFRCGTCFEYPGFDPVEHVILNIRVRPLIAMEVSIMDKHYLGMGVSEDAFLKFKELKDICRAANGSFTILWHNSHFSDKGERELYERVLGC